MIFSKYTREAISDFYEGVNVIFGRRLLLEKVTVEYKKETKINIIVNSK